LNYTFLFVESTADSETDCHVSFRRNDSSETGSRSIWPSLSAQLHPQSGGVCDDGYSMFILKAGFLVAACVGD
jgi:hypothetical protein